MDRTDPTGNDAAAAAAALSDVGEADFAEEVAGGGPEDPIADIAVGITSIGGLVFAGYELFQPSTPMESRSRAPGPVPDAEGRPQDANGGYTTHGPRDPITGRPESEKQYRPSGKDHGNVPRPNVKERPATTRPDGARVPGKPVVRPPRPDEVRKPANSQQDTQKPMGVVKICSGPCEWER